jgi:hypothetical protein
LNTCEKHSFELADGMCQRCGDWFCASCLVYAFGPKKPPLCISCAINAAGVRSTAGRVPRTSSRQIRREMRARRRELAETQAAAVGAASSEVSSPYEDEVAAWRQGGTIWEDAVR